MPDSKIIQISDRDAKQIGGVDSIYRGDFIYEEEKYPRIWFEALYNLSKHPSGEYGELAYCDADMIFCGDMRPLLDEDFDVAICKRPPEDGTSMSYRIYHPYNIGFMIVRTSTFWKYCLDTLTAWFNSCHLSTGQHVIGLVVNSGEFKVRLLDGNIYNRTPKDVNDFDDNVKVWHFKGGRKVWTQEWINKHTNRNRTLRLVV
jgi:hypothetical protein